MNARQFALSATLTGVLAFNSAVLADGENHNHDKADQPEHTAIAAVVNGKPISVLLAERVAEQLAAQGQNASREQIISELVNLEILAQQAEKAELDKDANVAAALSLQYTQTMANAYLAKYSETLEISEEKMRAEYEKQIALIKGDEYKASHILLDTEEAAKNIITELENGGDFAELAKQHSTGPTGSNGGDLGWFVPENMVPEFSAAVATLDVGGTTNTPVKTDFGWHVILLADKRASAKPDYSDQVKAGLRNTMVRQALAKHIQELAKDVTVEIN